MGSSPTARTKKEDTTCVVSSFLVPTLLLPSQLRVRLYAAQVAFCPPLWQDSSRKDVTDMNAYVTGAAIRVLREKRGCTQSQLAQELCVSEKTISKWETARGLPDISLLEPLARALRVSLIELMSGDFVINRNVSAELRRSRFFVCPVCGNVIHAIGESVVSCCGVTLPPLEAEEPDEAHAAQVTAVENEHFLTLTHPMEKGHFLSFAALVTADRLQLVKLYPEGGAEARFVRCGKGTLYWYCNRHGLFSRPI